MLKWFNKKRNKKAFTLVELVVVLAILGILAAVAVPKFSQSRQNAAITAHNTNVRILQGAASMAIADGTATITWSGIEGKGDNKTAGTKGWKNYLQEWPSVPSGIGEEDKATYEVKISGDAKIDITPEKKDGDADGGGD